MSSILKVKQVIFVLCLCFAISANAVPQAERDIVIGYGSHVLSLGFDTCMQKELRGKTFAQQELECLKEEFKEVKRVMDTTYQDIITLMEKKKWKERLITLRIAQKEFDTFVKSHTELTLALYGSRMAGFARYYESIDFIVLRRKHLEHLLEYYKGFRNLDHPID